MGAAALNAEEREKHDKSSFYFRKKVTSEI